MRPRSRGRVCRTSGMPAAAPSKSCRGGSRTASTQALPESVATSVRRSRCTAQRTSRGQRPLLVRRWDVLPTTHMTATTGEAPTSRVAAWASCLFSGAVPSRHILGTSASLCRLSRLRVADLPRLSSGRSPSRSCHLDTETWVGTARHGSSDWGVRGEMTIRFERRDDSHRCAEEHQTPPCSSKSRRSFQDHNGRHALCEVCQAVV